MAGATTLSDLAGAIGIRAQESAIVAELKAGSEDAYAWLIGEFHQPIYSLVYRIVTDPADAADKAQETSIEPAPDDSGLGTSGTWDTLVDAGESPFDSVMHEEVRARVEEELRQISEPYRTSVILRDLEDMSYEEIAGITEVSLGPEKTRRTRG